MSIQTMKIYGSTGTLVRSSMTELSYLSYLTIHIVPSTIMILEFLASTRPAEKAQLCSLIDFSFLTIFEIKDQVIQFFLLCTMFSLQTNEKKYLQMLFKFRYTESNLGYSVITLYFKKLQNHNLIHFITVYVYHVCKSAALFYSYMEMSRSRSYWEININNISDIFHCLV